VSAGLPKLIFLAKNCPEIKSLLSDSFHWS